MKPVTQTRFGFPDGNCYAAAIASILELPLENMPVIRADDNFNTCWDAWLAERHLARLFFRLTTGLDAWTPNGYCIFAGDNPRGIEEEPGKLAQHAVIAHNGELVWDPHPDRTFLLGPATICDILYPTDYGKWRLV